MKGTREPLIKLSATSCESVIILNKKGFLFVFNASEEEVTDYLEL